MFRVSVAQLDRATAFEAVGRGFESLRAHFISILLIATQVAAKDAATCATLRVKLRFKA